MQVLAGDVGGTKVLLQLAEFGRGGYELINEQRFESAAYNGLLPLVREFLRSAGPTAAPRAACFGIAGPITTTADGEVARVTNLPWVVEGAPIAKALGIPRVRLINDFQAVGYAIEILSPSDLAALQPGERRPKSTCAVVGAGTGLGQALRVWQRDRYEVLATEGGHVDFAPTDELQVELLRYVSERYGRVSYERLLSGPGLVNLYSFFASRRQPATTDLLHADDPPAAITAAALQGTDQAAAAALRVFLKVYGAYAGNVALSYLSFGGVFIAGGIAPKILHAMQDGSFMRAFGDKGRMSVLLTAIPVYVITNERAGLLGAALAAYQALQDSP